MRGRSSIRVTKVSGAQCARQSWEPEVGTPNPPVLIKGTRIIIAIDISMFSISFRSIKSFLFFMDILGINQ